MNLNILELPNDILAEISLNLTQKDYFNFCTTCKQLLSLNKELSKGGNYQWTQKRPIIFSSSKSSFDGGLNELASCKYVLFSGVRIRDAILKESQPNLIFTSIVHLEITDTYIDSSTPLTNLIFSSLPNLNFIILHNCIYGSFKISDISNSKSVRLLALTGDRTFRLNDYTLKEIANLIVSKELDMTGTICTVERLVTRRFYKLYNDLDKIYENPSAHILSFQMVLNYLRKHNTIVKVLKFCDLRFNFTALTTILDDALLKNITFDLRPFRASSERMIEIRSMIDKLSCLYSKDRLDKLKLV